MMQVALVLVSILVVSPTGRVTALQGGGYLSQLGGAGTASLAPLGPGQGGPAAFGRPSDRPPTSYFPAPSSTVGSGNGMADLYSSAPPGAARVGVAPSPTQLQQPQPQQQGALLLELWSDQVSVELAASQLYLSASIWFRTRNMPGMAAWMLDESGEERGHGLSILEFAMKRGFPVALKPLVAPRMDWETPIQVWESILEAEQTNTRNLLRLAAVANECGEYAATAFLDPFHLEQLDAEDKVGGILGTVRGATPQLLAQLDYDLGKQAEEEEHEDH
jgi:ferritin